MFCVGSLVSPDRAKIPYNSMNNSFDKIYRTSRMVLTPRSHPTSPSTSRSLLRACRNGKEVHLTIITID